jgi:RND family efflux transporter MFP subunit
MKRLFWLIIILALLGLAGWGLARALVPESAYARVKHGNVIYVVTGSVTVSAAKESQITSPEDGIVLLADFALKEGQTVKAGDVLARLDPGDIPFEQANANIQLNHIKTQLAGNLPSELELIRLQKDLADKKTQRDAGFYGTANYEEDAMAVDTQKALAAKERSDLETQQSALENSLKEYDDQLRRLEIIAPYEGTITSVTANPGDLLIKGQAVANLVSHEIKIAAEVNQDDIAAVRPGVQAKIRFFAYPGASDEISATVKVVLPSSDKTTQRFTVLLDAANPSIPIVPGLTGEVSFTVGEHDNVLRVPRRALYGNSVFVVNNGRVEVRQVTPAGVTLTQAEIQPNTNPSQTVADGEIVLTENLDLFRNGDRVRLTKDEDEPAQSTQK